MRSPCGADNADATVAERLDGFIYAVLEVVQSAEVDVLLDHSSAIDLRAHAERNVATAAVGELTDSSDRSRANASRSSAEGAPSPASIQCSCSPRSAAN